MIVKLQEVLETEIPLTKAIGVVVKDYDETSLTISAPHQNNSNHKNTAFGGSLYSVSVLSGWGLIYLLLIQHQLKGHIVIQESNTKFLKPVTTDIIAKCAFESDEQIDTFLKTYKRKGIARIQLQSRIHSSAGDNVIFTGRYVVHS